MRAPFEDEKDEKDKEDESEPPSRCGIAPKKPPPRTSPLAVNNDIYLLRDGKEMGPYTEETTQSFLNQGGILHDDLAWTPGLAEWTPLAQVLLFSATPPIAIAPVESRPAGEGATAKQKALLSYLGLPFSSTTTKEQAAVLVNEAMENPKLNARVLQWNDDRLMLHPDLFAAEAEEKKAGRAQLFFEASNGEGADRLSGVTLAHCQVLVTWLDVNFPNWDAHAHEAARKYFFPAVAEKFPQLVRGAWRGKLHFPGGQKPPPDPAPRRGALPFAALIRGLALGLALLLVGYVAMQIFSDGSATPAPAAQASANQPEPPKPAPVREPARAKPAESAGEPAPRDAEMATAGPPAEPPSGEPATAEPAPAPAAPAPRTILVITKATEVRTQFGSAKLIVGQQLKILSLEGAKVKARFGEDIVTIPIEATDLAAP